MKFGQDHNIDKRNVSWKFHQNLTSGRHFLKISHILTKISGRTGSGYEAKLWKVPSWSRILMKFSGNVSFINIMILSKFQVNCITLTNFGNFLNIGKFAISAKFQCTKNGCNSPKMHKIEFFLQILLCYTYILKYKWFPLKFDNSHQYPLPLAVKSPSWLLTLV